MRVVEIIADLKVADIDGAREFYTDYLGLADEEFNLGWVARFTSPETGAHLQLVTHDATAPELPTVSVKVDDVDSAYVEALYTCSYTIRKAAMDLLGRKHTVGPLEGLWSAEDLSAFHSREKSEWDWTMMIVQPEWVTPDLAEAAVTDATSRKDLAAGERVRFSTFSEGVVVQTLHVGPYNAEGPAIERLHDHASSRGLALTDRHHEIYLSDARKVEPSRLRTILRQPVSPSS